MRLKNTIFYSILLVIILALLSCNTENEELKIIDTMIKDESSFYYLDLEVYKNRDAKLPIGIFDSGTGGLTVFDAIVNFDQYDNSNGTYSMEGDSIRDFNEESFIYLADQANMPYGNYGSNNKDLLLKEHVLKDVQFLLSNKYYETPQDEKYKNDKSPIKAIVIACNTATAYAKEDIERFIKKANLDIKVIGVIGAGVRAAFESITTNENVNIAVMATEGTVTSNGYVKEINKELKQRNNTGEVSIFQQAGVGLAGAIDGASEFIDPMAVAPRGNYKGPSDLNKNLLIDISIFKRYNFDWSNNNMLYEGTVETPRNIQINSVNNYIAFHLTTLLEQIILKKNKSKLKSIILGCTHYPFYTEIFKSKLEQLRNYKEDQQFVYTNYLSDEIEFIDPALFTAKELYSYLAKENLFNKGDINNSEFYISVPNLVNPKIVTDANGSFTYEYKYGRNENEIQEYVKSIPFNSNNIAVSVAERLAEKIPFTYSLIKNFNAKNSKTEYLRVDERLK